MTAVSISLLGNKNGIVPSVTEDKRNTNMTSHPVLLKQGNSNSHLFNATGLVQELASGLSNNPEVVLSS